MRILTVLLAWFVGTIGASLIQNTPLENTIFEILLLLIVVLSAMMVGLKLMELRDKLKTPPL